MSHFSIAGLQLALEDSDNLAYILGKIKNIKRQFPFVNMIIVSELASNGSDPSKAVSENSELEKAYCEIARSLDIWLIPGSFYVISEDKTYNMAPVINSQGEVIKRYRKIYPFVPYEAGIAPGNEFVVFDIPDVGCFGVSICYDKWFPETTRAMVSMGAEVIIHPTLTNTIDRDVELAISRSNAATNQVYFFDINTAKPTSMGQSIVLGPGGEIIHQAGEAQETFVIEIDLQYLRRVRARGWQGLGQVLKSFRDNDIEYPQYQNQGQQPSALDRLGKLEMPSSKP